MITEDYVSFETAKLLKEKGFDEPCMFLYFAKYKPEGDFKGNFNETKNSEINELSYSAPTLQMAMKWLRKNHNIHIAIVPYEVGPGVMDYTYILYEIDVKNFFFRDLNIQGRANTDKISTSKTCEAAIKYCLKNLI